MVTRNSHPAIVLNAKKKWPAVPVADKNVTITRNTQYTVFRHFDRIFLTFGSPPQPPSLFQKKKGTNKYYSRIWVFLGLKYE